MKLCAKQLPAECFWIYGLAWDAPVELPFELFECLSEVSMDLPSRSHCILDSDAVLLPGWGAAVLTAWELDRTVQLRQELMLGMCEFEQAGYYAKEALAALGGDRKMPSTGLARLFNRERLLTPHNWVFFGPPQEIEALRTAVCRQLWTEINNARSFEALQPLVERYGHVAELEDEYAHVVAGYLALPHDRHQGLDRALAALKDADAAEFEEPIKRAEMLADVVRGRIQFALNRDGN